MSSARRRFNSYAHTHTQKNAFETAKFVALKKSSQ